MFFGLVCLRIIPTIHSLIVCNYIVNFFGEALVLVLVLVVVVTYESKV